MNSIKVGDILHFKEYIFTDTGEKRRHFALTVIPQVLFSNSIYCAVITKQPPRNNLHIALRKDNYSCFSVDSFVTLDRLDIQSLENYSHEGALTLTDLRKGLKVIHLCIRIGHKCYKDKMEIGTIIREWKKHRDLLASVAIVS